MLFNQEFGTSYRQSKVHFQFCQNIGSLITLQYDQGQTKAKVGASCNETDLIRLGSFTSYDLALVFAKE